MLLKNEWQAKTPDGCAMDAPGNPVQVEPSTEAPRRPNKSLPFSPTRRTGGTRKGAARLLSRAARRGPECETPTAIGACLPDILEGRQIGAGRP